LQTLKKYRRKKKLGSYPFATVVFSITMALFVIGLCGLMVLYATRLSSSIRNNIEIQVYLDKYVAGPEVDKIVQAVETRSYLQREGNNPVVRFISKEEAEKDFIKDTGEDHTAFLGENPLRDALLIRIKPEFYDSRQMKLIKLDLEKIPGVFEASYVENLAEDINRNIVKITLVMVGFATVLLVTISLLINNTIKLAMFSQRFLIRSMQLVGATSAFIQKPFLIRAALHGLTGGILASILLTALLLYAESQVEGLEALRDLPSLLLLMSGLCLLGIFIGTISAYRSIRKYLLVSLDELY
jgi:cell division transport system permease protein